MTGLFRRSWKVIVDNLDVSTLDVEFKILRSLKPEPNKAVVVVWNMAEEHRAQVLKRNKPNPDSKHLTGVTVQVEAGYEGNTTTLLSADLREATSQRDNTNWKTTIAGSDGGRAYREGVISKTFTKGTPISTVLQQCAEAMGIGLGNVTDFEGQAEIAGIGKTLAHTLTAHGNAAKTLDRVIKSMGFTWSIQSGALQVLNKGTPLNLAAIKISPSTGLLGSPEASIDSSVSLPSAQSIVKGLLKTKSPPKLKTTNVSVLRLKTLLIPGLVPARKIELESAAFSGSYMITEVEYVGQSWSNEWGCNAIARAY